jgi:hypothetical protein
MKIAIIHAKNIIAELINYTLYVMVEITFFAYFSEDEPGFFTYAALGLIPIGYYFVRCYVHRFWAFALLHLLPPVLVFGSFDYDISQKILFSLVAAIYAILSLVIRLDAFSETGRADYGVTAAIPPVAVGLGLVAFMLTRYDSIIALTIAFIALYLFHHYLGQFLFYTDMNRRTTGHVPSKDIFHLNIYLVGAFTLVSVVVMASAAGSGAFSAFGVWLYNTLRRFLRWLVSLLPSSAGEGQFDEMAEPPPTGEAAGLPFDAAPPVDNIVVQVLERILIGLTTIIFYMVLAAALWGLIVLVREAFRRRAGKAKPPRGRATSWKK